MTAGGPGRHRRERRRGRSGSGRPGSAVPRTPPNATGRDIWISSSFGRHHQAAALHLPDMRVGTCPALAEPQADAGPEDIEREDVEDRPQNLQRQRAIIPEMQRLRIGQRDHRLEERRVGKEWVSKGKTWVWPD